ncbi:MAG: cytochrome P450 [Pseudomonadales bacterium]|nr:cytochrome P450 [Pseudomonadales bacterium]
MRDRRFGRQINHLVDVDNAEKEERCPALVRFDQNSLLEMEPPTHTRLRRLVSRAFVSRQVETQREEITTLANTLIDKIDTNQPFDLLSSYAEVIPVIVICKLLGVPTEMADQLLDWSHKMVAIYEHGNNKEVERIANEATLSFEAFIESEIENKKRKPSNDLLSALIKVEEEGERLNIEELIATSILLLNAGHEATVHGIGNGVKAILENSIDVTSTEEGARALTEECLRFDPPLHMFTRFVLEDLEYQGQAFKQGDVIGLLLGSANRDEEKFSDAHLFNPTRGGIGHTSFGAGIHFCVGAPLARLEIEIALSVLFERLPKVRIGSEPVYADRYHFHGLEALVLHSR